MPGRDPALERRERDLVAGPVVDRPQADVVARVEIAVVDREVRPVQQRQERLRVELLVVRRATSLRASFRRSFVPSDWASRPALIEVEVGRWRRAGPWRPSSEIASRTSRVRLVAERQAVLRASRVRVLRSVSWSVHSWSETMPFHGSSTICSPSSIALARTTSSSAVSRATLPISLRYIRTGSSIPIMSAESASSSSAVGSSTSRVELGWCVDAAAADGLAVLVDDLDGDVRRRPRGVGSPRSRSSSSSSSSSTCRQDDRGRRAGRSEASLASSRSALARRGRVRTASTSC